MASAQSLIPQIEAFVDSSRSPREQAASIDAVAALVIKDALSLESLVREMELYLTTTDNAIRARGILFLAEILTHLMSKPLNNSTISSLAAFFTAKLADWQALRGALIGCLVLLKRNSYLGTVSDNDARLLAQSFLKNVQAQSLAMPERKLCFEILQCLLDRHPDSIEVLGDDLVYGVMVSIDREKDPRCLLLTFHLVETMVQLFPEPSVASFAEDIFDILGCYFPITFTQSGNDVQITRDNLSKALMQVFCSSPFFEPFVIPLLLEKLSSSLLLAKLDSLKYLNKCISEYGSDRMIKHARTIWNALKDVIFCYSSKVPSEFASTETENVVKSQEIGIVDEALLCLQTALRILNLENKEMFLDLILEDKDIEAVFLSLTAEANNFSPSSEAKHQLKAVGSILAISVKASRECCNRIFERYLSELMDILGVRRCSQDDISNSFTSSSGRLNFGALYIAVELVASFRDVVMAVEDLTPQVTQAGQSGWMLLKDYSGPFVYRIGSGLASSNSFEPAAAETSVDLHYRVKGLQVISTFPGQCSPVTVDVVEDILLLLILIIIEQYEDTDLWKLSLGALVQIGLFIGKFDDTERRSCYKKIVERMVSWLYSDDSAVPLSSKLEAISRIGATASGIMSIVIQGLEKITLIKFASAIVEDDQESAQSLVALLKCYTYDVLPWCQKSGKFDEVAVSFAVNIWNLVESEGEIKANIKNQDLCDAVMMTMKLLVGGCTEGSQTLLMDKAHTVFTCSLSIPLNEIGNVQSTSELLSLSSKDEWLIELFASVLIALRAQVFVPNVSLLVKFLVVLLLKGHVAASQALASIVNKWPSEVHKNTMWSTYALEETVEVICESTFSNLRNNSWNTLKSHDSNGKKNILNALSGLAWIGKGLLMRGHKKVMDVAVFLLDCICSSPSLKTLNLDHFCPGSVNEQDSDVTLARFAADSFDILLSDSETCLNKTFHATIRPLYKQRFFSIMMPVMLSLIKESKESSTRPILYRAFGHIICNTPIAAVVAEAKKVIPALLGSLSSEDIFDKDLIYNRLLVLSGIMTDENGKDATLGSIHAIVTCLMKLISYPHKMVVRETAIQCLGALVGLPHARIYPLRPEVLRAVSKALGDKKRAVRQEAVRCRQAWASIASRGLR